MKTVHISHDLKNDALLQLLKTPPFKLRYFHISIYAPSQYNVLCIFYFFFIKGKKFLLYHSTNCSTNGGSEKKNNR